MNRFGLAGVREDWPTWVFAFIVACGLYYFISGTEEITVQSRVIDLVVKKSDRVAVASALPTEVNLRVEGPVGGVKAFLDNDPKAELNLVNASDGMGQELRFIVKPEPTLGQVKVTINPSVFLVDLEQRATAQFKPAILTNGELREGLTMSEEIENLPAKVSVTGPASRMQEVDRVIFRVDLSQFEGVTQQKIVFQPVDATGIKVPFAQVTPADVEVRFFVSRKEESVRLPVLPLLKGGPAPGYLVSEMHVEPTAVEVTGRGHDLARLLRLETDPINIQGISTDQTYTAKVAVPRAAGIEVRPTSVTVRITVEQLTGRRTIAGVPISLNDQGLGHRYVLTPATMEVVLQGSVEALSGISEGALNARIRVGGYLPGDYELTVEGIVLTLPPGVSIVERSPATFTISVLNTETPVDPPS